MGRDNKTTNWSGNRNTTTGDAIQPRDQGTLPPTDEATPPLSGNDTNVFDGQTMAKADANDKEDRMCPIYRNQQFYRTQIIGSMMFSSGKSISRKKPNVNQYVYEYQPFIHYILIPRVFGLIVIFCILKNW